MNRNFCESITNAISSKKVVIYGAGRLGAIMLNIMDELGKEVLFFLDKNQDKQKTGFCGYDVKPPEDILYENMLATIVVIASTAKKEIEDTLTSFGLRVGIEFIFGIGMRYEACDAVDPFLGYSRSMDKYGFKVMGNYDSRNRNVLCLGGSTTDYTIYGIKSWPEYLFELFREDNININIFNGGTTGYSSSQELLKLIRDGLELAPFLVISYSGVNDLGYIPTIGSKYLHEIWRKMENTVIGNGPESMFTDHISVSYGIQSRLDSAEYWYRNEIMMSNICHGFSIHYLGILQPSTFIREDGDRSLYEERVLSMDAAKEYKIEQFKKAKQLVKVGHEKDIVDFTSLFDMHKNVYADDMHVFEEGNKIIAESIYQIINERHILDT